MSRYQKREIDAEQAILEATHIRQNFDLVPELQANFAFTKAYVAERSGTKGGLGGPKFFVDLALFETPPPAWLVTASPIKWSDEKLHLEATFAPLVSLSSGKNAQGGPTGIRDGHQVAQFLAHDPDVLKALRAATKPSGLIITKRSQIRTGQ